MAVSFISTIQSYNSGAGTHVLATTRPFASDKMLIASIGFDGPVGFPPAPTGVTFDGVAPTYTLATDTQSNGSTRGYRLHSYAWANADLNPAFGAGSLSVTIGATVYWTSMRASFFSGVRQSAPASSIAKKGGTPAPSSSVSGPGTLSLGNGIGLAMDHLWQFYGDTTTIAPDAGQTLRGTVNVLAGALVDGCSTKVSVFGTNTMSWTNTSWSNEMEICMLAMFALQPPPDTGAGILLGFNH